MQKTGHKKYFFELRIKNSNFTCPGKTNDSDKKEDIRIIIKKTRDPLMKRLEDKTIYPILL
jgi:hypothetical protein